MPFFIARVDNQRLSISMDQMKLALARHWPEASITETEMGLAWSIEFEGDFLLGQCSPDMYLVSIDCSGDACAQFVDWFMHFENSDALLLVHDESENQILLDSSLSSAELRLRLDEL